MLSKLILNTSPILTCFFICVFFSFTVTQSFADEIRILASSNNTAPEDDYYIELTRLVLSKNHHLYPKKINIVFVDRLSMTAGKEIVLLNKNIIDIIWSGTDSERESNYLPIRFPLFRGLLGYRSLLIMQENKDKFLQIKTPDELKKMIACQGSYWADSDILEANGYPVIRLENANLMLKMLANKRCDYFPRAIFEGVIEQETAVKDYPNIILINDLILHYELAVFYFVKKNNVALAERLKRGLITALSDGSFMALMKSHKVSRHLFPLSKWKNKRYFELSSDTLNGKSPIKKNKYWFDLKEM